MYCSKCGNYVDDNMKFCSKCGEKLTEDNVGIFPIEPEPPKKEADNSKLIKDLSIALPIYKHLSGLYDQIFELQYKQNKKWKFILTFIVYAIGITVIGNVLTFLCDLIALVIPAILNNTVAMVVLIGTYVLGVVFVIFIKKLLRGYYQKKIDAIESEMQAYLKQHDCPELYCLPERYRNYIAGNFIYDNLSTGRAESLKEATNLYEQQVQIWEMEARQQNIQNELERQRRENERIKRDNDLLATILMFK